jgi:O-antigen/teichoic acid export membrane protein
MGIVFRQSIKTTLVTFSGAVLAGLTNYIYAFILSKTELGFLTNIIYTGALLQFFVTMGTGSVLAIFTQRYPPQDPRRKMLFTFCFSVTFIATIVFSFIYLLFKDFIIGHYQIQDRPLISSFYNWVPVLIFLWTFMSLCDQYLVSQSKIAISAFMREVLLRICNLALALSFFYKLIGFDVFIISNVLVYLIPSLVLFIVSSRTKGFGFSFKKNVFTNQEYREIAKFAWYHLLMGASLNLIGFMDTLMLAPLDKNGMQSVAPYRLAVFIVTIMVIPYRAMATSSHSALNQAYIDNDIRRLKDLFSRSGINILIVAVGMTLLIGCNLHNAVAILPPGYEAIKPVAAILMLGRFIDMATGLNNEVISISKYYKFNFRVSVLLLIMAFCFNRTLIPIYGIYGAAWGITIALCIFNILKMIFLWYKMQLHPFTKGSLQVIFAGAAAGIAGYYLPHIYLFGPHYHHLINPIIDISIRTAVIVILYCSALIWLKPSADINTYVKSIISTRRLY